MPIRPLAKPREAAQRFLNSEQRLSAQGLHVQPATPKESEEARELFRAELSSEPTETNPTDGRDFLVVADGSSVIGAIAGGPQGGRWGVGLQIHSVAVTPDRQGAHVGTALISAMLNRYETLSFVWGGCNVENIGFYRRLGFLVADVGEPMPLPNGDIMTNKNKDYPHFFYLYPPHRR